MGHHFLNCRRRLESLGRRHCRAAGCLERYSRKPSTRLCSSLWMSVWLGVANGRRGPFAGAPADILVAKFPHFTSRGGISPFALRIIERSAIVGRSEEVSILEPRQAYAWQVVLGLAFRTALSQFLVEMGFSVRAAGRDPFKIAGIPDAMIERFSKRSQQIRSPR